MNRLSRYLIKMITGLAFFCMTMMLSSLIVLADNPIIQTSYTADPAPMLYNDTVYLYTTHDADDTRYGFFSMIDWKCYSTKDMVNWTDHGTVFHLNDISWSHKGTEEKPWDGSRAWAAQCIERDGKFYLYVPVRKNNGGMVIGVGVADRPEGPFTDPLDRPLVDLGTWDEIDPTVYVDDDGTAYLYWGNPTLKCAVLGDDMISIVPEENPEFKALNEEYDIYTFNRNDPNRFTPGVYTFKMKTSAFGERENTDRPTSYEEGPWFTKRNGLYYMIFAAGPLNPNEHLGYSTSSTPIGPWEYRGRLMEPGGAFTIHPGIVDYKGRSFLFYHNNALPGGGGFKRSVCLDEFTYNEDGTIPPGAEQTTEGPAGVATLNPYVRTEAETIAWTASTRPGSGSAAYKSHIKTEVCDQGGMNIRNVRDGNYIKVKDVDFGERGADVLEASVSCDGSASKGGTVEIYLDSLDGQLIGELSVSATGGWNDWMIETTELDYNAKGVHDLFFMFKGGNEEDLFKMDYWQFKEVVIPAAEVRVTPETLALRAGQSRVLNAVAMPSDTTNSGFVWTSSDPAVAEVDTNGKVRAKAPGTAVITAEAQDGSTNPEKGTCTVTVINPATGITISPQQLNLVVGDQKKLSVVLSPADVTDKDVAWTSGDPSVATVSEDGTVTARGAGAASIFARTQDGSEMCDICIVMVAEAEKEYKITYQLNGGKNNEANPDTYHSGISVSLKSPTKAKYVFAGWYSDSSYKNKVTVASGGNITLYAKWQKITVPQAKIKSLKNYKSKTVKLVVKKVTGVKYEVLYARDAKFKKGKKKTAFNGTSKTIKNLKKRQAYYFKVRAYKLDSTNKKVYGKYSKRMKVIIKK